MVRTLSSLTRGSRRELAVIVLIASTALVGGLAEAGFLVLATKTGLAVSAHEDTVSLFGGFNPSLRLSIGLAGLLVLCKVAAGVLSGRWSSINTSRIVARARRDLANAYLGARWDVQQGAGVGQLQDLLTTFTDRIQQLLGAFASVIVFGFNLLALLILSVAVEPIASLIVIVVVGLLGAVMRPVRNLIRRHAARSATLNLSFAGSLSEISDLGLEFHVFHVQREAEARIDSLISKSQESNQRLAFAQSLTPTIYAGLAYVAVLVALGGVVLAKGADIGSLGAVMLLMLRSLSYGQSLQIASSTIHTALPYHAILERRLEEFREGVRTDDGLSVDTIEHIEFHDVTFEYSPDTPVLHDMAFSIGPREVVGIMGPSGGGKSTLVQLILGLREPTQGRVLFDGVDVGSLARAELARKMTFVPQDSHLFNGTVEENIRFMRPGVTRSQIEMACRAANLWADVEGFDDGLKRQVGDRGDHLSGGQKQRLCIARALVERPDVLILDEPTSALDVKSEQLVRDTLTELSNSMSVIIIAHRLSTLEFCDRIMVVHSGCVVAFDTAESLER
ncbi:MAG: ABC transporter ATP-binding protein, partial [Acidimicrobiia bacterium]|nr:ABC transporter ATP-binding protein [Acidimicrobiia bacterium]